MKRHLKLRRNFVSETGTERSIAKAVKSAYRIIEDIFETADTPLGWDEFFEHVLEELNNI